MKYNGLRAGWKRAKAVANVQCGFKAVYAVSRRKGYGSIGLYRKREN